MDGKVGEKEVGKGRIRESVRKIFSRDDLSREGNTLKETVKGI